LAYCTANDVRLIADLTTADIDDTTLTNLIAVATQKLNADVVALVKDERVEYIDEVKTNEIDGSNKTFYTKFLYLGDRNDDGTVDVNDVEVYQVDSDGTKTTLTVTSVDAKEGKFVLDTAPSNVKLYVSYGVCPVPPDSNLLKQACAELTAAYAFGKIDPQNVMKIGRLTLKGSSYQFWMSRYYDTLRRIMASSIPRRVEGKGIEFK